jgi:tetratricopeptide (TPR) repeat protein
VTPGDFDEAVACYQRGDAAGARERLERFVLATPEHAPAWHLLGVLRANAGAQDAAKAALERATAIAPGDLEAQLNLGRVLQQMGANGEAAAAFGRALERDPKNHAAAEAQIEALWRERRYADAIEPLRRLLVRKPEDKAAARKLLTALRNARRLEEAEREARAIQRRFPDDLGVMADLAAILRDRGQTDEAIALSRRAIAIDPGNVEARINLGAALSDKEALAEAAEIFQAALDLRPDHVEARVNLGAVRYRQGDPDAAIACYRPALARDPSHVSGHWNLSHALLQKGEFREGWAEYEWRWQTEKAALVAERRKLPWPRWAGGAARGKRLFVYTEQGFGDSIQFVRYVPLLAAAGAVVTLEVQKDLERLCRSLAGVHRLLPRGAPVGEVELQVPVMSLPHLLGTTLETVPAAVPYLAAEPEAAARWRRRLADLPRPWIGLCWKGGRKFVADHLRSIAAPLLAPLVAARPAGYVALMKDLGVEELGAAKLGDRVRNVAGELGDFAETAALVANLDLVISVDTAVAHLAGALARPLWVLLPEPADFRWLRARVDSPWYPTARLFRQPAPGDWPAVLAAVGNALSELR